VNTNVRIAVGVGRLLRALYAQKNGDWERGVSCSLSLFKKEQSEEEQQYITTDREQ
jgi:hypothetical protein